MNPVANAPRQSILMAADVGGCSSSTLDLAVRIAASMKAPLQGLFVEDEDLLQVTALPISREISLTTARERSTDVERMRRALRALATQFELSLEREARAFQVGYSFEYIRGRVHDIGLHARAGAIVTILERKRPSRAAKSAAAPGRVLWITHDPEHELLALHAVMDNFAQRELELIVVGDTSEQDLADDIRSLHGGRQRAIALQRWSTGQLLEKLAGGVELDLAVLSRPGAKDNLATILKSITCPVILVT